MSTAAFTGVTILPHSIFGANNKINLAFVGIGGKGHHAIRTLGKSHKNEINFVAFSDVDNDHAQKTLKKHPSVPFFGDFRRMMDKYHKKMTLTWQQGRDEKYQLKRPPTFEKGRMMGNKAGGSFIIGSKNIIMAGEHGNDARIVPETERKALYKELKASTIRRMESSHYGNWLNAIKGKEKCRSSFAYGGRLTEVVMLGNIALHLNRDLKIDPNKKEIINDPEATALMLGPQVRKGWEI